MPLIITLSVLRVRARVRSVMDQRRKRSNSAYPKDYRPLLFRSDFSFYPFSKFTDNSLQADGLITVSYFFKLDLERFDVIVPVVIGSLKTPGSFS